MSVGPGISPKTVFLGKKSTHKLYCMSNHTHLIDRKLTFIYITEDESIRYRLQNDIDLNITQQNTMYKNGKGCGLRHLSTYFSNWQALYFIYMYVMVLSRRIVIFKLYCRTLAPEWCRVKHLDEDHLITGRQSNYTTFCKYFNFQTDINT